MRLLKKISLKVGLLHYLEQNLDNRIVLYCRSLFSIYDVKDMVELDLTWWTFPASERVSEFIANLPINANVFEYGPGASTIWLAKRGAKVTYVEHDRSFGDVMNELTSSLENVFGYIIPPVYKNGKQIKCRSSIKGFKSSDFTEYVLSIRKAPGPFDLIIIDGLARNSCLKEAIKHLKPNGIIVFDDTERTRYNSSIKDSKLTEDKLIGLRPGIPYITATSLLKFSKIV